MTPDDPRHGTYAGAKAHKKADEQVCEPCRVARNAYLAARKRMTRPLSTRTSDRLEDLRWMVETGECATGAARRLGISLVALEKWCANNNARAEWRRLRVRETELTHNGGANQWSVAS